MKKKLALALVTALVLLVAAGYAPDTDPTAMKAKYTNAASRFVELPPGLRVHVRDEGVRTGRTLVLIHGSGSSLHTWEPWVARLRERCRVVTFDLPGHGLTGAHPADRYTQLAFVDVTVKLMAAMGVESAVMTGNSMGGGIAWRMAV